MPDINPLTNNQIFLKKISENTGSDYETGDVSEINPLTIDQIFLKEIAANTAGQAGDITELEEKVTANTAAIEAIVSENGCCNILPNNASTTTVSEITFKVNADKSVTAIGNQPSTYRSLELCTGLLLKAGTYVLSKVAENTLPLYLYMSNDDQSGAEIATCLTTPVSFTLANDTHVSILAVVQPNGGAVNATIYPMLYDARFSPTGYVQHIMTNKQLTDKVEELTEKTTKHSVTIEPISPNDLQGTTLSVVNGVLVGSVCFFRTDSTDYLLRQWVTVAHTSLRLSQPIQTSLYSEVEGLSGGLMNIGTNGDIMVFQNYYDPTGTATKRGASGMFSTPI